MSKQEKFNIGKHEVIIDSSRLKFDDATLSKYMEEEAGWYDYYGAMLAIAERHLALLDAKHEKIYGERFAENKDMGGSDKLAEARAKSDQDVSDLKTQMADAKFKVSRLKQHLRAWDKGHDNAQSMGHMQRKAVDKLNATIMAKVHKVDVPEILMDMAAQQLAGAEYEAHATAEPQENLGEIGPMQEGTRMEDLMF